MAAPFMSALWGSRRPNGRPDESAWWEQTTTKTGLSRMALPETHAAANRACLLSRHAHQGGGLGATLAHPWLVAMRKDRPYHIVPNFPQPAILRALLLDSRVVEFGDVVY
jgi:hypothetical protein